MDNNQIDPLTLFEDNQSAPPAAGVVLEDEEQPPNTQKMDALHEDMADPILDSGVQGETRGRRELCNEDRVAAYNMLLQKSVEGKLKRTTTTAVAQFFNVNVRSIQRLWKRGRDSGSHDVSLARVRNCGRKRIEFDLQKIRDVPLRQRTTLRSLASALGVSKSFLISKMKSGELRRHSNAIKPTLTEANCQQRVRHCLASIDPASNQFYDMENVVHIDEKWFQMTKKVQTYYLAADEDEPVRTMKSCNFIPKIMFLVAVARPRYNSNGDCTFDGRIGVFPLVADVPAVRNSANRVAGTIQVKPITRIDRAVIREFMIQKILPVIKEKWPRDSLMDEIIIQQDNAKTHIHADDLDFLEAVDGLGLNIKLLCQPPNSPDLNVLDLGFFRAIQSLQSKKCARDMDQLVAAVKNAFLEFPDYKANSIFLTLQSCMIEILKIRGSNVYRIPHMNKEQLIRQGMLPSMLSCDPLVIATAIAHLPT